MTQVAEPAVREHTAAPAPESPLRTFAKLVLSFAPWLCFLILARETMFRLELGIVVGLVLSAGMAVTRLHRGVIMWVGLAFFTYATLAVFLFHDMWTVRHMGVLANGSLAAGTWLTMARRMPFTLEYARDHTDPGLWNHPVFLRLNYLLTGIWGLAFTINALLALAGVLRPDFPTATRELISYAVLLSTAAFTTWYPGHVRRAGLAAAGRG